VRCWVQEVAEPVTETRITRKGDRRGGGKAQEGRRLLYGFTAVEEETPNPEGEKLRSAVAKLARAT
jgi:hypothetical protein